MAKPSDRRMSGQTPARAVSFQRHRDAVLQELAAPPFAEYVEKEVGPCA